MTINVVRAVVVNSAYGGASGRATEGRKLASRKRVAGAARADAAVGDCRSGRLYRADQISRVGASWDMG